MKKVIILLVVVAVLAIGFFAGYRYLYKKADSVFKLSGEIQMTQVDVAFKGDRACVPYALWHHQLAAALLGERVYGLGEGFGAERRAVAFRPEVFQVDFVGGEGRCRHLFHLERQVLVQVGVFAVVCRLCAYGKQEGASK